MKKNEVTGTIKALIKSLEKHISYKEVDNNYENISSYKGYIFSRYLDKLSTLAINYIRIYSMHGLVSFPDAKKVVSDEELNDKFLLESDLELIVPILRPLLELFLELKSIELTLEKFKGSELADLEKISMLIYYEYNTTFNEMKLNVCKDFYNCEPKFLKLWSDTNKKEVNDFKQKFAQADIPLLKNTRNKLLEVIKSSDKKEILLLGYDYLTFYAIISKKSHFSYSNVITENYSADLFLHWCLFYFLSIYLQIMTFLEAEDDITKELAPVLEVLNLKIDDKELNPVEVGKYVMFDFGIAEVLEKKKLNLKVKYIASNAFESGTEDEIPKVFVKKELDKPTYEKIHKSYYEKPLTKYHNEKYEEFYFELIKS